MLGDGKGMVNHVHFLLEGECRLIEHMIVRKTHSVYGTEYELYDPEKDNAKKEPRLLKSLEMATKMNELEYEYETTKVCFIYLWYLIIVINVICNNIRGIGLNFVFFILFLFYLLVF